MIKTWIWGKDHSKNLLIWNCPIYNTNNILMIDITLSGNRTQTICRAPWHNLCETVCTTGGDLAGRHQQAGSLVGGTLGSKICKSFNCVWGFSPKKANFNIFKNVHFWLNKFCFQSLSVHLTTIILIHGVIKECHIKHVWVLVRASYDTFLILSVARRLLRLLIFLNILHWHR